MTTDLRHTLRALNGRTVGFSKKAMRARRAAREGVRPIVAILREGERAFGQGASRDACPYVEGTEERSIWMEGYDDAAGELS